jgi:hypothetical protein
MKPDSPMRALALPVTPVAGEFANPGWNLWLD